MKNPMVIYRQHPLNIESEDRFVIRDETAKEIDFLTVYSYDDFSGIYIDTSIGGVNLIESDAIKLRDELTKRINALHCD